MKSLTLYNQDGSLSPEAQILISHRPDNVSRADWRKTLKDFRSKLSTEDLKEFERLRKNKLYSEYEISKRREAKREKQELIANIQKINLYDQDGVLCAEAQQLLSHIPHGVPMKEWKKTLKTFKNQLSSEDCKEFERLRNREHQIRWRANNPEKVRQDSVDWRAANPEKSKEMSDRWRAANPEYTANWYINNSEKAKQDSANWRAANPERSKEMSDNWRAANPDRVKENHANWRAANPGRANNYHKQRKSEDPLFRLHCNMRNACSRVVKQLSLGKKPTSTFKWIGCSPEELKAHLESLFTEGMTWENYGEWHVDHIRPVCSFTAEEWEQVNHYTNLRPLWAEDNIAKSVFDKRQSVKKETPAQEESPTVVMN